MSLVWNSQCQTLNFKISECYSQFQCTSAPPLWLTKNETLWGAHPHTTLSFLILQDLLHTQVNPPNKTVSDTSEPPKNVNESDRNFPFLTEYMILLLVSRMCLMIYFDPDFFKLCPLVTTIVSQCFNVLWLRIF